MIDFIPDKYRVWLSPAFVGILSLMVLCNGNDIQSLGSTVGGFIAFLPMGFFGLAIVISRQQKLIEQLQKQLEKDQ